MAADFIITGDHPTHMLDSKGRAVPVANVKDADKLISQTVDKIHGFADELNGQVERFKGHTYDDVYTTVALLAEQYGVKRGGEKGNITLTSFDGLKRVRISIADQVAFGPQLQIAKQLVDQYIEEFRDRIPDEIMPLLTHAFHMEKPGVVNSDAVYGLQNLKIEHPIWEKAMRAITDCRVLIGSKSYVVIERRADYGAAWKQITINLAKA